jgi:Cu-Zn family superoxide dismutase
MVRNVILASLPVLLVAATSPALAADTAHAVLKDKDGKEVGKVDFTDTPSGVLMRLDLTAVPPGEHALHLHTVGKCEPPDFKSAGGHFNPDETKHGLLSDEGPHAGDLPNIYVPESGKITIEVLAPLVSLSGERALLDDDGTAIVIHDGADDALTDPAGNAGDRIVCGVVTQ